VGWWSKSTAKFNFWLKFTPESGSECRKETSRRKFYSKCWWSDASVSVNATALRPVLQAGLSLTRDRCRSALVMDEADRLVGIVTLEDIQPISFGTVIHQRLRVPPDFEVNSNLPYQSSSTFVALNFSTYTDEPVCEF